jgi:two-component system sensor histidine kinase/response regulator
MVTAYGREEVLKQAEENAFANVLIKPVTASMLFDSALEVLGANEEKVYDAPIGSIRELSRLRDARVLLVEDNELNREVALGLLEDAHLLIDLAENGKVAVQMVSENKYDIVLMDMQMPVMDGVSATKAIRSDARLRTLPIVAMTANVMAADRENCIEAGMNDHIAKPIDPDELFAVLLRWIRPRNGGSPAMPVSTSAPNVPAAAKLPGSNSLEIAGVDTQSALKRTGGNPKRYESLLRKFARPSAEGIEENSCGAGLWRYPSRRPSGPFAKGSRCQSRRELALEVAAKAEDALSSGNNVEQTLIELAHSFAVVVGAIRSALPDQEVAHVHVWTR